jgi:hypothetical protein
MFLGGTQGTEIRCEAVVGGNWTPYFPQWDSHFKTCRMHGKTQIDEDGVTIADYNPNVLGLTFKENKKIRYLPVEVSLRFPKLFVYIACYTSITGITKANFFEGFKSLRILDLSFNKIEGIYGDTFEDLISLELLWLCENLKFDYVLPISNVSLPTR